MRFIAATLIIGALALAACGGNGGTDEARMLVLPGGTLSEAELRPAWRAWLAGIDSEAFCKSLAGLSDTEVSDTLRQFNLARGTEAKQTAVPADAARAGAIMKEECDRITG